MVPRAPAADGVEDLEDLYENAPCGYLSLGPDGRIVKVNRTLTTWMGMSSDELFGKRLRDLLNMPGRIFYETHFAPLLRMQGFFSEVALDLITANGLKLPVLANAAERRGDDGALLFTRVTVFPAVERRRYERGLVEARSALEAAGAEMRSKLEVEQENAELREQFIAVLGHDLRNPLASISSATNLLRKGPSPERALRILDLMEGSVVRMSGLIDNILDFARGRLGSGIVLNRTSDLPLEPVLRQVVEELRLSHPDREIQVWIELHEAIDCDLIRIGQLASNLLGNALTHGDPGKPIEVGAKSRDGTLEFWVANGGDEISDEAISKLFQPFFRGDMRPNQQGLGLGLHIASQIAVAHGGRISVTSNATETRFTFVMPSVSMDAHLSREVLVT
jgi:sigma-B regulation protein RsbU (phosphoserine phosphatase)